MCVVWCVCVCVLCVCLRVFVGRSKWAAGAFHLEDVGVRRVQVHIGFRDVDVRLVAVLLGTERQ